MAFGLRLSRVSGQGENQGGQQQYDVSPSNTTKIYRGDPVKLNGGFIEQAAAGDAVLGSFNGCQYVEADGSYKFSGYWNGASGSSNVKCDVAGDGGSRFMIALDSSQGNSNQAMIGTRRNHIVNAGSDVYQDSRVTLGAAAADGTFFVVGVADLPGNTLGKAGTIFEVTVAKPQRTA